MECLLKLELVLFHRKKFLWIGESEWKQHAGNTSIGSCVFIKYNDIKAKNNLIVGEKSVNIFRS